MLFFIVNVDVCEHWESGGATEASLVLISVTLCRICVDIGSSGELGDVEVSSELLAALQLVLVQACVAVLAELVVEEVLALPCPPEGVLYT